MCLFMIIASRSDVSAELLPHNAFCGGAPLPSAKLDLFLHSVVGIGQLRARHMYVTILLEKHSYDLSITASSAFQVLVIWEPGWPDGKAFKCSDRMFYVCSALEAASHLSGVGQYCDQKQVLAQEFHCREIFRRIPQKVDDPDQARSRNLVKSLLLRRRPTYPRELHIDHAVARKPGYRAGLEGIRNSLVTRSLLSIGTLFITGVLLITGIPVIFSWHKVCGERIRIIAWRQVHTVGAVGTSSEVCELVS